MNFLIGLKRIVLLLVIISCAYNCFGQTPRTNYIRTRVPQIPVIDTSKLDTIPVQRQAVNIKYNDALGRTSQSVVLQGSPTLQDVIMPFSYDNMGRMVKTYLPYADESTNAGTAGTYRSGATAAAINFYNPTSPGASKIATDAAPYAQTVYEASPLGRVTEQGNIGSTFQPGTTHTIRSSYNVNAVSDGINYYTIQEGVSVSTTAFGSGVLAKTIITDGNGHRQAVWKDLQGRIVTKTQLDAPTAYYSTDYVYDDLNQLANIITPLAKKQLSVTSLKQLAYTFHYDSLGRVVEKKIPSKGWTYIVYNHTNLPVLTQDSNMRVKNQWMYIKYDAEGRQVQTGIYINKTVTSRKGIQNLCDTSFPILWETWQPGTGYTNNAFPQQSAIPAASPLTNYTIYYYDDYSFTEAAAKPFQTNVYNSAATMRTMGMRTGMSIYVLGTSNQRLVTVDYYDIRNRLIQEIRDNHLGQVDLVNNQFNFIGELTGSQKTTTPTSGNTIVLKDRYVYDHLGRLQDTYESFQGAAEVDISHNIYNEISQKVTEGLYSASYTGSGTQQVATTSTITENTALTAGKTDIASTSVTLNSGFSFSASAANTYIAAIGVSFTQTQEFRYSIRGELTSINNGTLNNDGVTQTDPNALFGESITYSETSTVNASPQYNGNISSVTWRNKIEQTGQSGLTTGGQGYAFTYDNVDRSTKTSYYTQTGSNPFTQSNAGALTENVNGYDEMGNIDTLQRKDKSGNLLNKLTYTYNATGNQLQSISDAGSQNISGTFAYDGNGNMTSDSRKSIALTYNYLNLVDTVKQGNSKLVFTYDAAGNKLYKQLISSGNITSQRHYVEDVELTAGASMSSAQVESVSMQKGRIVYTGSSTWQYEYQLTDHLGNIRVSFRPATGGGVSVTQVQNYYPFGSDMGDASMNYTSSPQNLYKYSGKEQQPELSLNTYDFGARHYDPVISRWTGVDPLAEVYHEYSPYNYVMNNPMNIVDPDGMGPGSNTNNIPFGGGENGLPSDGYYIGAITSAISAWHSFSWSAPSIPNWNVNLGNIQQNVNQIATAKNANAGWSPLYKSDLAAYYKPEFDFKKRQFGLTSQSQI